MTGVDEMLAFLRLCLDEDERVWREAFGDPTELNLAEHYFGPGVRALLERQLAEVEAKRRILDEHQPVTVTYWPTPMCGICADPDAVAVDDPMGSGEPWTPNQTWPCRTIRLLAQPYAGQPGWREEWRA